MREITVDEAKRQLLNASPGLYADLISDLNCDKKLVSRTYESYGAILVRTFWYVGSDILKWFICDIGNSNMTLALDEISRCDEGKLGKIMIYLKRCEGIHCLIFSSKGREYIDSDIRILNIDDSEQVSCLTALFDDDNNRFSKSIANNLTDKFNAMQNNKHIHLLGTYIGIKLVGAISISSKNNNELVVINDVFVAHKYRGRGYAKRLIQSAMALYPDARYHYSCGSDNYPSIASAESAGFTFEGTYIFV